MNIGILTSTETRHHHFVRRIHERYGASAVVYEDIGYSWAMYDADDLTDEEQAIVRRHYAERADTERDYYGAKADPLGDVLNASVLNITKDELNTERTAAFLNDAGVDVLLVYGTDLIKPPLFDAFAGRMVNMHLGLSPYYRGTATNFYPLLNDEPEYVGTTIHLLDAGIDSGPILVQARPDIVADDRPHTIGCRAIDAGIDALVRVLPEWFAGRRKPVPQWSVPNPRLYLRKDFQLRHVVELHHKIEDGLIRRYVERADEVAPRVRLVT